MGKQLDELQKLRQELGQYRAEYAAYQAAEEHRAKVAERKGAIRGVVSTLIVTVIGGLVVSYWPDILAFLASFTH